MNKPPRQYQLRNKLTSVLQPVRMADAVEWKAGLITVPVTADATEQLHGVLVDWENTLSERHQLTSEVFLAGMEDGSQGQWQEIREKYP